MLSSAEKFNSQLVTKLWASVAIKRMTAFGLLEETCAVVWIEPVFIGEVDHTLRAYYFMEKHKCRGERFVIGQDEVERVVASGDAFRVRGAVLGISIFGEGGNVERAFGVAVLNIGH